MLLEQILRDVTIYSSFIPALLGIYRLRRLLPEYRFFVAYVVGNCIIEQIIDYQQAQQILQNPAINMWMLFEFVVLALFFRGLSLNQKKRKNIVIVLLLGVVAWLADSLQKLADASNIFNIFSYVAFIFWSVQQMNVELTSERNNIFKNANLLISGGVLAFFFYFSVFEIPYFLKLKTPAIYYWMGLSTSVLNIIVNLLFAIATLWIPSRRKFILPY